MLAGILTSFDNTMRYCLSDTTAPHIALLQERQSIIAKNKDLVSEINLKYLQLKDRLSRQKIQTDHAINDLNRYQQAHMAMLLEETRRNTRKNRLLYAEMTMKQQLLEFACKSIGSPIADNLNTFNSHNNSISLQENIAHSNEIDEVMSLYKLNLIIINKILKEK